MKKFRYRLEPLLKVKSHIEKQRQKEHAVALQQVFNQKDRLAELSEERDRTFSFQRSHAQGPVRVHQLLATSRYIVKLKRDAMMGAEMLKALETEAERKRELLVEASRERKIYEKLKEKQQTKFNGEIDEHDRKTLDEMAVVTFAHRRRH